jgi:hypothetical protein
MAGQEQFHGGRRLLAIRAFEIAVFDDRYPAVRRPEYVVSRAQRFRKLECPVSIACHCVYLLPSRSPGTAGSGRAAILASIMRLPLQDERIRQDACHAAYRPCPESLRLA